MSIKLNDVQQISQIKGKALINLDGKFAQIETSLLKGIAGEKGEKGEDGAPGSNGKSAYELYVDNLDEESEALSEAEWIKSLKGEAGEKGQAGSNGKTGNPGTNARNIELRKSDSSIEWRSCAKVEPIVDYTSAGTQMTVSKEDTIAKLSLINVPKKAVYAQIKTVSMFGVNAAGEEVATINPSIITMRPGVTFPPLEGFDPSKKEYDISKVKEIEGNMGIQSAINGMLEQFPDNLKVVDISRIILFVSFLDANKAELCQMQVKLLVQQNLSRNTDANWNELLSLSDITGPKGEDGKGVEMTLNDGHIKWRKTDTYSQPDEGWNSIISIDDIVNRVLEKINTIVEN